MKQTSILTILLALAISFAQAQSDRVEPFFDAVPYSINNSSHIYLTNQDASAVKDFFTQAGQLQPAKIVPVDDGYYHGYRLYYNSTDCTSRENSSRWMQVVTIDTRESIVWFEKHNPDLLMVPFLGMETLIGRNGHSKSDFRNVYNHYKHLSCRLYQQIEESESPYSNKLAMVLNSYHTKINLQTDQMLASGDEGVLLKPGKNQADYWELWLQCLGEIDQAGYITLIEYSDPPANWHAR